MCPQRSRTAIPGRCLGKRFDFSCGEFGDVPRSDAGDFGLVEKVGKAPPRGKPLGYPHLRESPMILARFEYGARYAKRGAFAPLDALLRRWIVNVCLCFAERLVL